jgi:ABC-2 type transport system permease protein
VLLFTAIPAGFISSMPVRFIRDFDASFAWAAFVFFVIALTVFHMGLRRYASGNRIGMRM